MVCLSDSEPSAGGASVCHVSAEDVNLLYALQQFGTQAQSQVQSIQRFT